MITNYSSRTIKINALCIFLLGVLTGCQMAHKSDTKTSILEESNADKGSGFPGFGDIPIVNNDNTLDRFHGTVKPSIAVYLEKDAYLVKDAETVRQIQSVLARLQNSWQGETPQGIEVFIKEDESFNAATDQYNQIFLSTGLLSGIKNDDQLTAVLAHELSHILLKHNQDKSVYQSMPWTFEKAGALATIVEAKYAPGDQENTTLITESLSTSWSDIGSPAWTRENEREADKMGLDLMIKAGYNPEAFFIIMMDLQQAQINQGQRLRKMADRTKSTLVKKSSAAGSSIPIDFIRAPLTDLIGQAIDKTIESLHNVAAKKNVDYDSPEERQDKLKTYYSETYPEPELPKMKKSVWNNIQAGIWNKEASIKNEVNGEEYNAMALEEKIKPGKGKKKAKTGKAIKQSPDKQSFMANNVGKNHRDNTKKTAKQFSYEDVLKSDYVPAIAYIEVSQAFLNENNPSKSPQKNFEVLKLGAKRIGSNYRFLPYLIPAAKSNGDTQLAEQYTIECSENKDSDLMQDLISILGKTKVVNPMYSECVKGLGYDPLANKTNNQNNLFPIDKLIPQLPQLIQ